MSLAMAPARFTFDLDLRRGEERPPIITDDGLAERLQEARMAGYAEGFAAGEHSTSAAAARVLGDASAAIARDAEQLLAGLDAARHAAERDAIELATSVARKLAAHLVARQPTAELEALLVDCLASLDGVPHLVIRCHPDLVQQLRDLAAARISTSGFSGRLIVMGDPDLQPSDGRIEWADGGLVRDMAAISAAIDDRIEAYSAARANIDPQETA